LIDLSLSTFYCYRFESFCVSLRKTETFWYCGVYAIFIFLFFSFGSHLIKLWLNLLHISAFFDVLLDIIQRNFQPFCVIIIKNRWLHQLNQWKFLNILFKDLPFLLKRFNQKVFLELLNFLEVFESFSSFICI